MKHILIFLLISLATFSSVFPWGIDVSQEEVEYIVNLAFDEMAKSETGPALTLTHLNSIYRHTVLGNKINADFINLETNGTLSCKVEIMHLGFGVHCPDFSFYNDFTFDLERPDSTSLWDSISKRLTQSAVSKTAIATNYRLSKVNSFTSPNVNKMNAEFTSNDNKRTIICRIDMQNRRFNVVCPDGMEFCSPYTEYQKKPDDNDLFVNINQTISDLVVDGVQLGLKYRLSKIWHPVSHVLVSKDHVDVYNIGAFFTRLIPNNKLPGYYISIIHKNWEKRSITLKMEDFTWSQVFDPRTTNSTTKSEQPANASSVGHNEYVSQICSFY